MTFNSLKTFQIHLLIVLIASFSLIGSSILIPNSSAEKEIQIPSWIKNNAGWWATNQIDDSSFLLGIQYLIKEGIMVIPSTETSESAGSQKVPGWIKNNAGWWADGQIDDGSFVSGIQWLISNGIIIVEERVIPTDIDLRVAFIADQGNTAESIAVLNLIKHEGAQMVLHQGDFDYYDNPDAWDRTISNVLGDNFPYFASIGHHDMKAWNGYQEKLYDRLKKNPDAKCIGDLGIKSSCTYKGLFFLLMAPGDYTNDSDYDSFIKKQLNDNDFYWNVCSWHNDMYVMQTETEPNETGFEVYESCKNGGAIIANAHWHFYARSNTLINIENHIADPEWPESNKLRVEEGATFIFISGLGGNSVAPTTEIDSLDPSIRILEGSTHKVYDEWPINYAADQSATYGALFCTFNPGGQLNKAYCYFKNINGVIIDAFTITSFLGSYYDDTNPIDVDMSGKDLTGNDLSNTVITDINLSNAILVDADLSNTILIGTTLTKTNLTGANLTGTTLTGMDLTNTILRGANLTGANLYGVNLSGMDLTNTILRGANLTGANLTGTTLTGMDLTNTILRGANLTGATLTGMDLTNANLAGQDLSDHDLTDVIFTGTDLSNSVLPDDGLSGKNFDNSILDGVDLSGKDLSHSLFRHASFKNTNLKNTNLYSAEFLEVDLTKIKNKSLAGANLIGTAIPYSNLSGINLDGSILGFLNWQNSNLSGIDFTVISNKFIEASVFKGANLSNTNFEGIMFPNKNDQGHMIIYEFKMINGAHLANKSLSELSLELHSKKFFGRWVIEKKVVGNDLLVKYIHFNDFSKANLHNANLSNADLTSTFFSQADFTNADLSNAIIKGANASKANLHNANLSNADLTGAFFPQADFTNADLSNAILSKTILDNAILNNVILNGAILNCVNHPICIQE